jgi:RNA polymerase sigma factor (sigma-70 family)
VERHAESARSHYSDVFRFVRSRVRAHADAEDVAQQVFLSAAEALGRSAATAPPSLGWLYTVARRRLVDEARRRRVETVPLELVRDPLSTGDEYGGRVAGVLDSALAALAESQRAVVVLRLLEGCSFAEIGAELGASEAACRVRFMRGLEQLRIQFEKEGLTP